MEEREDEAAGNGPMIERGGAFGLLCCLSVAQVSGQAVPRPGVPDVIGPVPGRIFFATSENLSAHGYVEEEFFLAGAGRRYDLVPGTPPGALEGLHPYRTRVVVRRPADPVRFNGTVLVEWLNVTVGHDIDVDWILAREHILREGFAWVGVSAQRAGVAGLREWDPVRYGSLDLTADFTLLRDELAYDVFRQAVAAVRGGYGRVLGPLVPEVVIATGHSQSASRLSVYHDRVQPISDLVDGFVLHGGGPRLSEDVGTKVFKVNAESDLWAMGQALHRQDDSDVLRTWEVAGASHVDWYYMTHLAELQERDLGSASAPTCDRPPLSRVPFRYVLHAAYEHLDAWIRDGVPPPRAPPLEVVSFEPEDIRLARDARGNALGGIRLPHHAVPVATNGGRNGGGAFCRFFGAHEPFDGPTLARLYPTRQAYVDAFTGSVRENLRAGYVLADDAERMIEEVEGGG